MKTEEGNREFAQNIPLVSVIVPIYNVEKYLSRCVHSIREQSLKNIEIILVDDGSPDGCGALADQMALQDFRVKAIHKENGGVSSARNAGLKIARGEYIAFVDADDYLEKDYLAYFVDLLERTDCEMAVGVNNFTSLNKEQVALDKQRTVTAEYVVEALYLMTINVAVWNKLYKHSFLKKHNLWFNESIWYGEGMLFNIECLQCLDCVALGEKKMYHQVLNPDSAMRKFNLNSNYCGIRSLELQKEKWVKSTEGIEKAWTYHYRCFSNSILCGLVASDMVEEYEEEYRRCIKNLHSNIFVPLQVAIPIKMKIYYLVAAVCPVMLAKRNARRRKKEKNRVECTGEA